MKSILITGKTDHPSLTPLFEQLQDILSQLNCKSVIIPKGTEAKHPFDMAFCVGGDGSFLSAARQLASFGKPIVIIYAGRLGFLPCISPKDLSTETIAPLLEEGFPWMQRMMLKGSCSCSGELKALNEFYFTKDQKGSLSDFLVRINGSAAMKVRADGLIVSSPTGSTAYNLSAGGPILMPSLQTMIITPVCSHILGERPLVVGINDRIEIVNKNERPAQIWADGQEMISLNSEETFALDSPSQVCTLPALSEDFFSSLSLKLGWNSASGAKSC